MFLLAFFCVLFRFNANVSRFSNFICNFAPNKLVLDAEDKKHRDYCAR